MIDRDADTRQMYSEFLRTRCDVEEAADGREALAKALMRHPDVIVTETRLPGINGFELCRLLRHDARGRAAARERAGVRAIRLGGRAPRDVEPRGIIATTRPRRPSRRRRSSVRPAINRCTTRRATSAASANGIRSSGTTTSARRGAARSSIASGRASYGV
ncbi:MAG TPA: response regulator [Vicinamibacterales bacterium]|nr:response regulator [Vicinamibacterales bacterium]